MMEGFDPLDVVALVWFFLCWIGFPLYSDRIGTSRGNLLGLMAQQREDWMTRMLGRDNRVVDIQIVRVFQRNYWFFASTAMLILLGLITVLGVTDKAIVLVGKLPFTAEMSEQKWETLMLLLIFVFVYAFFKFTWAMRQLNYFATLIGLAPLAGEVREEDSKFAPLAGGVVTLATVNANRGARAYYFGLSLLAWFIHPLAMIVAATLVVIILYRREFTSKSVSFLRSLSE
jgi:uncharacterized membrane protein